VDVENCGVFFIQRRRKTEFPLEGGAEELHKKQTPPSQGRESFL
jgi:hypothetical protein